MDQETRSIEAFALATSTYRVAGCLAGDDRGALPPFESLTIAVDTLWA